MLPWRLPTGHRTQTRSKGVRSLSHAPPCSNEQSQTPQEPHWAACALPRDSTQSRKIEGQDSVFCSAAQPAGARQLRRCPLVCRASGSLIKLQQRGQAASAGQTYLGLLLLAEALEEAEPEEAAAAWAAMPAEVSAVRWALGLTAAGGHDDFDAAGPSNGRGQSSVTPANVDEQQEAQQGRKRRRGTARALRLSPVTHPSTPAPPPLQHPTARLHHIAFCLHHHCLRHHALPFH
jgi:hypothetical protein